MNEFNWPLIFLVFFARIADVSLGTLRIIYINKGKRMLAPLLGFFEVFIWIVVVSQLVRSVSSIAGYIAYAAGFAAGNFIGIAIESKLAIGTLVVRTIVSGEATTLIQNLIRSGYGVTVSDAHGSSGPVKVIFMVINRRELEHVIMLIKEYNPHTFYSVEEARMVNEGVFHRYQPPNPFQYLGPRGKR